MAPLSKNTLKFKSKYSFYHENTFENAFQIHHLFRPPGIEVKPIFLIGLLCVLHHTIVSFIWCYLRVFAK